jgi:hypothetical protein
MGDTKRTEGGAVNRSDIELILFFAAIVVCSVFAFIKLNLWLLLL